MSSIYKWQIWCNTENKYTYVWSDSETVAPSTCPNDTNHDVLPNSMGVIDYMSRLQVEIKEEIPPPGATPTGGYFQLISKAFDCPANTTSSSSMSYPHPICIMGGYLNTNESMAGDIVSITAAEGTIVGVLTSPITSGDTEIHVSSTVLSNVVTGRRVSITDGTNTTDYITVIAKNTASGTVTLRSSCPYSFAAGSYVRMQIVYCDNVEIGCAGRYEMGSAKIGGTYIPPNTPILVKYTNNGSTTKRPSFIITILY